MALSIKYFVYTVFWKHHLTKNCFKITIHNPKSDCEKYAFSNILMNQNRKTFICVPLKYYEMENSKNDS